MQSREVGHGTIAACQSVPLNTVKLPKCQNIFITVAGGDFQGTYMSFSQSMMLSKYSFA